jgi:Tol biopolymer transport system component
MFSEIKMGVHMGLVASADNRMGEHDLYLPGPEPSMAHRSYLSPDRKWVLLVEMDEDHLWEPCRVVPVDGSSQGRKVGPPQGGCTVGAWSPDGKWIYLNSNAVGANHIWRQRFPEGKPELLTSGPTEEEGIAITPDGRSLISSVALRNSTLWVHDAKGDRRISIEGNAANPKFTPDGKKLCFRKVTVPQTEAAYYRDAGEVYVNDLDSGRSVTLVPGMRALSYDLSPNGRDVAMAVEDAEGKQRIWIAPLDRSAPPRQIPGIEGGSPLFGADGDVLFRHVEGSLMAGTTGFIYRVHPDGTGMQKAIPHPILIVRGVSTGRRWVEAWAPIGDNGSPAIQLFPLEGGFPVRVIGGSTYASWSPDGASVAFFSDDGTIADGRSYLVQVERGDPIPRIPAGGFHSEDEVARLPGARRIDQRQVAPGPLPGQYAFYSGTTIRNLYRIPID